MATPALLDQLLRTPGPSGHETGPAAIWRDSVAAFSDDVRVDGVGSSSVRVPGTGGGHSLAIVGHIDEIGIHVTHIDDEGYLRFGEVGGWDPFQLIGQRVRLATRGGDVLGVIGRKPIHLLDQEERGKAPKIKDLHIDIGAADSDEARATVRIGDVGVIDAEPIALLGNRIASRSLDNRIGSYVAAEVARLVAEEGGAPGDVIGLAVVQEETGFAGARTSAFGLQPDVAIAVDVTHATDAPGIALGPVTRHALGSGPVVARGTIIHPVVVDLLCDTADELGMAYTIESIGGATHTDADVVHTSRAGVATGVVSVPLRYMHSAVELADIADIEATARLIAAFARKLTPELSLAR
ncbi:MAG TPA: M42 family metallopeptidase [Solirubrobacteraceae bacterium]|nr:M42 family metallopeptidase [Solirubrobacteraceae bacterium]